MCLFAQLDLDSFEYVKLVGDHTPIIDTKSPEEVGRLSKYVGYELLEILFKAQNREALLVMNRF